MAVQIQHSVTNGNSSNGGGSSNIRPVMQGFIAALKDGFGFIETSDHNKEVFFHFRYVTSHNCLSLVERIVGLNKKNLFLKIMTNLCRKAIFK